VADDNNKSGDAPGKNDEGKLPAAIAKIAEPVIGRLKPEQRVEVRRAFVQVSRFHKGPLPDPDTLRGYAELIPNGPERIMALLEKETAHRHEQERTIVQCHTKALKRGQWIGLALTLTLGAAGFWLGMHGHDWLAGIIFATTILGVVTVFVVGRTAGGSDEQPTPPAEEEEDEPAHSAKPQPPQKRKRR
jgi:uncharacterized membrane protein